MRTTRLQPAAKVLVAAGLFLAPAARPALAQSQSGFTYNGINLVTYQADAYLNSRSAAQTMRATGANYAGLVVTQYMQTGSSTVIAPETTNSPGYVVASTPLTPTDAALVSAIQSLQAQGLTVSLKPHVDSVDGVFRGLFAPADATAWFRSYQAFILHYAQIAAQNKVGMLVVGTEFRLLSGPAYKRYWQAIIAQIRSLYPSLTLTYAANATSAVDEFSTVSFWQDLDLIGVDGYIPLTSANDPGVPGLVAAWTSNKFGFNALAAFKALQATYNKPLIFTELGYVSVAGTNQIPYANLPGSYDGAEQQNCYEAFFEVFRTQAAWMKGVFWWAWSVGTPAAHDIGYTAQGKPAATVTLPRWFGSTTPGFTLAPSHATFLLRQGSTATVVIAVTTQGGFAGAVSLGVTGLPAGVSGTFSQAGDSGGQLLTLTAAGNAATGRPLSLTVTGTSGRLSASTKITFTVAREPSASQDTPAGASRN